MVIGRDKHRPSNVSNDDKHTQTERNILLTVMKWKS